MQKLSKDTLKSFRADITSILSSSRLKSYEGDIESYYANRLLALRAGHKIAEIEIYLRNMLDFCLRKLVGEEWIREERSLDLITPKNHIPLQELSPSQILSSLMLGEVIELIGEYKVEHYMFELENLDFKKYHWSNNNFFKINSKKTFFSNVSKVIISLNLMRSIRNRCFHWENLLKVTIKQDGKIYPRITTIYPKNEEKKNQTRIGIAPDKILEFLDDLLNCIDNQVMRDFQDIEMKYRKI
ncbi:CAAX protease [Helicobacter brantae]|uniref:CAAX protease n=1 Tax=Helicobacter brantae TaxID=375927 RepID=A0A3D8IW72_9HELI|nr:CAAX protease [Helicobacter brantae]RDU68874.1 CAAX protease [Helicobacter brantae]